MAYTPVPAVAADDWIDEVFINTYWVENMASSVPDVFSAKGQMAVGLGVDSMGVLNVGADGTVLHADSVQALGMIWKEINIVYRRQGGSNTGWDTQGTTDYIPANARVQVGSGRINFAGVNTAAMAVTYPVPYAYAPAILLTLRSSGAGGAKVSRLFTQNETTAGFYAYAELTGVATGTLDFFWMALGPSS